MMSLKRFPLHRANRRMKWVSLLDHGPPQSDDGIFRTQLVAAVTMFSQVMQDPRFLAFLQHPLSTQQVGSLDHILKPDRVPTQVIHTANSIETPVHLTETMQSPKPMPNAQEQVAETPIFQAVPVQPATFQQPKIGSNGQGSNFQAMQQVFPPPSIHPGTVFGGARTMMPNPMYGSIGIQPGFQSTQGQLGMPQANFGMAGISNQQPFIASPGQNTTGQGTQMNPNGVPMFQTLPYDNLTPLEKPTPYKEGGKGVTFSTFTGFDDGKKALSFLQQFDKAYARANLLLYRGFKADVMTEWHQLNAASCKNLNIYNRKFWKALLPPGHIAPNCPQRNRPAEFEDKEDRKGKKPMASLVPEMVGNKPNSDVIELCKAWRKVRHQTVLIFFDQGAKTSFISPELASKLGVRPEEMGYTAEAGLACPCHIEAVTPIIGKLRLRNHGCLQQKDHCTEQRKDSHTGCKAKRESIPTVSTSITSVMKKHLSTFLVFARVFSDCDESDLFVLDKERSMFLQQFSACFSDSLPSQSPPERSEDHSIDLVPGSSPPNRPLYRVSAAQQKEIMSQ
ncbi:hypothetical protein L7F22_021789 [Adiantum nelumboides]|nr:hypothetical protein [Adiantum nelumboides]